MASEPTGGSIRDNDAMTTISGLLAALQRDGGRPRVTAYDDGPSPTQGERIELSGRVLGTWVAKAANLLTEELDVQPGDRVALDLPAHWRALYWGLALWSCGACVIAANHPDARALITPDPEPAGSPESSGDEAQAPESGYTPRQIVDDDLGGFLRMGQGVVPALHRGADEADHLVLEGRVG